MQTPIETLAPQKFRKLPVEIEAMQFELLDGWIFDKALLRWLDGNGVKYRNSATPHYFIAIETLKGTMEAKPGDWIIKGVNGEFYPCKPDIFADTYELA